RFGYSGQPQRGRTDRVVNDDRRTGDSLSSESREKRVEAVFEARSRSFRAVKLGLHAGIVFSGFNQRPQKQNVGIVGRYGASLQILSEPGKQLCPVEIAAEAIPDARHRAVCEAADKVSQG